jgi:hypothetical protein
MELWKQLSKLSVKWKNDWKCETLILHLYILRGTYVISFINGCGFKFRVRVWVLPHPHPHELSGAPEPKPSQLGFFTRWLGCGCEQAPRVWVCLPSLTSSFSIYFQIKASVSSLIGIHVRLLALFAICRKENKWTSQHSQIGFVQHMKWKGKDQVSSSYLFSCY